MGRKTESQQSSGAKAQPSFTFVKLWRGLDYFGQPVTGFNVKGEKYVTSGLGTIMSLLMMTVVLIYAVSKSRHIQTVNGQTISTYQVDGENNSQDNPLNLSDKNVRVAFKFEAGADKGWKSLHDPRYVRIIIRTWAWDGATLSEKRIPHHECTDADFAQFYPINTE